MRKISLILVSLLLACNFVMAQGGNGRTPRETTQEMTDRMVKEYSLNDEQKAQLLVINEQSVQEAQKRFEAMRAQGGGTNGERPQLTTEQREKMRAEMQTAREAYDVKVQKIFTEDQFKAYQKKEKERRENRQQRQ